MNAQNLIDQLNAQNTFFDIGEESIMTGSGITIPGKKAITNGRGDTLGIVSDKYKVVTNEEIFTSFVEQLVAANVDLTDATAKTVFSHNGARTMVDMTLPAHSVETSNGDQTVMRITTLNSYDGRWKFTSRAGGIRMACLNGQVLGGNIGQYSEYHNQQLDVQKGAQQIVHMFKAFNDSKDWWKAMMAKKIRPQDRFGVFATMLTGTHEIKDREKFAGRREVKKLEQLWAKYSIEMGTTAWALYNVMTDYVTHKEYNEKAHGNALKFNEERIGLIVSKSKLFEVA